MVLHSQELVRAVSSLRQHLFPGNRHFKFDSRNQCIWQVYRDGTSDFRSVRDRNQRLV